MSFKLEDPDSIVVDGTTELSVTLDRDVDEDEQVDTTVIAPYFPVTKNETWWLVVSSDTEVLGIKRVTLQRTLTVKLDFVIAVAGSHSLKLSCMSDSYMGADQEADIELTCHEKPEGEAEDTEME